MPSHYLLPPISPREYLPTTHPPHRYFTNRNLSLNFVTFFVSRIPGGRSYSFNIILNIIWKQMSAWRGIVDVGILKIVFEMLERGTLEKNYLLSKESTFHLKIHLKQLEKLKKKLLHMLRHCLGE
ncbi:unnamed protein product [Lactuca virosa]|uniref:Uncharacterized protein n=1 Tax=Lactuca virosa TaxID=75947 RepID=A0AAU9LTL7_9ASTR|nr:unnamed protein product [Lactuca virosa]